jgi:hypothetical protein
MWKVWRTELADAARMTPDSRKLIWRAQAIWSSLGSQCLASRPRKRLMGSADENEAAG